MSVPEASWIRELRKELLWPVYSRICALELEVTAIKAHQETIDKLVNERLDSLERDTAVLGQDLAHAEKNLKAVMTELSHE